MAVVATAGHVDHGKSTLVRALTGIEPDRWEQERARGLTIDLGYAWTTLPSGQVLAFVDVPGHQRFIGNMLAGIGPAAAVMFVVAADEGWRRQSEEHLAAVDALGIDHRLLVVTRADLADPGPALDDARRRLSAGCPTDVRAVAVSALTGRGLEELSGALAELVAGLPAPRTQGRTRLWLDRAFTIRGAGTVVTGTLGEGRLRVGEDVLLVSTRPGAARLASPRVRGLHSLEEHVPDVAAVSRAAVNLPGVEVIDVARGDVVLTGDWPTTTQVDVRLRGPHESDLDLPEHLMLHVGTAALEARLRPLGAGLLRLTVPTPLPLVVGDRAILRNPATQHVVAGVEVLDADPPTLRRRGAAAARAGELAAYGADGSGERLRAEVRRRGAVRVADLERLGLGVDEVGGVRCVGEWLVDHERWRGWADELRRLVDEQAAADPLEPTLAQDAVVSSIVLPQRSWLAAIAAEAGCEVEGGRVGRPGVQPSLGAAEAGLAAIETRLAERPWAAPEQRDLEAVGLGPRELAAAVRLGRVVRLPGEVVLLPTAPALAMRELARLAQPFTTSQAREALETTRRVVIPLLEHLDACGWTRRLDGATRVVAHGR